MRAMTTAADMVRAYMDAEIAILQGQTVTFQGRTLTRANLADIRKGRQEWERRAAEEAAGARAGALSFCIGTYGGAR